jgi:hypothetical protein
MSAWAKESSPLVYCGFKKNKNKITDGFWHFGITVAFRSGVLVGITRVFFSVGEKNICSPSGLYLPILDFSSS